MNKFLKYFSKAIASAYTADAEMRIQICLRVVELVIECIDDVVEGLVNLISALVAAVLVVLTWTFRAIKWLVIKKQK